MRGRSIVKTKTVIEKKVIPSTRCSAKQVIEVEKEVEIIEYKEPLGISFYGRWVPEKSDHGQLYANLGYQVTDNLRVGFDYRPLTSDLTPLINWRAIPEGEGWRPSLILGMSNDDFGDVNSDSYYGTLSKYLGDVGSVNVSAYAGATYIDELNDLRPVGGLHLRRGDWSAMLMYSGVDEHVSITKAFGNQTFTFLMYDLKLPGLAYGISF